MSFLLLFGHFTLAICFCGRLAYWHFFPLGFACIVQAVSRRRRADVVIVNVSIPNATQNLKAKADAFKESGLTLVVIASLKLLLYDHDTFSAATLLKTNPSIGEAKIQEGKDAVANIHNAIVDAIVFYGGTLV